MENNNYIEMPITNVYAKGGFSVLVNIGSNKDKVRLILDSGSSTLVVKQDKYQHANDQSLIPTPYAQCVRYGIGGWYGPVVKTEVDLYTNNGSKLLEQCFVSIAKELKQECFAKADGILGLAYRELNDAHDVSDFLSQQNVNPAQTYPWVNMQLEPESVNEFHRFLQDYPQDELVPYFTQLESTGMVDNRFGFIAYRSSIHHHAPNLSDQDLEQDPLNQGLIIFGGGVDRKEFYEGEMRRIKGIADVYYNVRLLKLKVDGFDAFDVPKLQGKKLKRHHSNAFMDTGASMIVLDDVVFNYIIECFEKINPEFKKILEPFLSFEGVEEGIDAGLVDLKDWPTLEFIFEGAKGEAEEVSMLCEPHEYWQVNAPRYGEISFKILSQLPGWPDQSILGLPLLSGYYTIQARAEGEFGDFKFAKAKANLLNRQ